MILDRILEAKRKEVTRRRKERPFGVVRRAAEERADRRPFRASLEREGIALIAEMKRSSPSAGLLREEFRPGELAAAYERAGAVALSVLTDAPFFGGALEHLGEARAASKLPLLRKDFVIDPYQVAEAGSAGADAFLLIASALDEGPIAELLAFGTELGLDALVEVHDEAELDRVLAAGARLVGVNNRDLRTFTIDLDCSVRLAPRIPEGVVRVSESGIEREEDLRRLADAGYDAVLVGTSLMRAPSPEAAARRLLGGGG